MAIFDSRAATAVEPADMTVGSLIAADAPWAPPGSNHPSGIDSFSRPQPTYACVRTRHP